MAAVTDVDENRRRTGDDDRVDGRHPGHGRDDDVIAWPDAAGAQREINGVGTRAHANAETGAAIVGNEPLPLLDRRPHQQPAVAQDVVDGGEEAVPQLRVVYGKITIANLRAAQGRLQQLRQRSLRQLLTKRLVHQDFLTRVPPRAAVEPRGQSRKQGLSSYKPRRTEDRARILPRAVRSNTLDGKSQSMPRSRTSGPMRDRSGGTAAFPIATISKPERPQARRTASGFFETGIGRA